MRKRTRRRGIPGGVRRSDIVGILFTLGEDAGSLYGGPARFNGSQLGPDDFSGGERSKRFRVLRDLGFTVELKQHGQLFPDQVDGEVHFEGEIKFVTVNRYERDPWARDKCIKHYGSKCQACSFDFGVEFGEIGTGFIHVHHLIPLSDIRQGYVVDPVKDLRPVCPNCHAMMHRRSPPLGIAELRQARGSAVGRGPV